MRAPDKPKSPKEREAEAIARVVELICSRARELRLLEKSTAVADEQCDPVPWQSAGPPEDVFIGGGDVRAPDVKNLEFAEEIEIAFVVRTAVNFLLDLFANFDERSPWGNQAQNKRTLSEISEHLRAIHGALDRLPAAARILLFAEGNDDLLSRLAEFEPAGRRFSEFVVSLHDVRLRVADLMAKRPGERENANFRQKITVDFAKRLLRQCGLRPTRGNDSRQSVFEQVAAALYEAATGESDATLIRACREAIKQEFQF